MDINMNKKQLVILGGGYSITEGYKGDLWFKLHNHLTCGINYSYKYFNSTYFCCMNYTNFYDINRIDLVKLPLIVTPNRPHPSKWESNTILINKNFALSGILALYIGLLLEPKEIFLLGYDYKAINNHTHFYQGAISHRGIGNTKYYDYMGHAERDFNQFKDSKIKIYNVSPESRIELFEKINYITFFKKLDNVLVNQEKARIKIKEKLEYYND